MSHSDWGRGRILVVCTANQGRSPAAEVLLQQAIEDSTTWREVESAGTEAQPGKAILDSMARALDLHGIDVPEHRSRLLTVDMVEKAHLVLTMTEKQRHHVNRMHPKRIPHSYTIRELDRLLGSEQGRTIGGGTDLPEQVHRLRPLVERPSRPEDVADPIEGGDRLAQQVLSELATLVQRLGVRLST